MVLLRHMQAHCPLQTSARSGLSSWFTLGAGMLVLLAATVLAVYKPWGMTPYGRRKEHERRKVSLADLPSHPGSDVGPGLGSATRAPR